MATLVTHSITLIAAFIVACLSPPVASLSCNGNLWDAVPVGGDFSAIEVSTVCTELIPLDWNQSNSRPSNGVPTIFVYGMPGEATPHNATEVVDWSVSEDAVLRISAKPEYASLNPCLQVGVPSTLSSVVVDANAQVRITNLEFDSIIFEVRNGSVRSLDSGNSLNGKNLTLDITGYGNILLDFLVYQASEFEKVTAAISGTGDIAWSGTSQSATAEVSGTGDIFFMGPVIDNVTTKQTGEGDIYVRGGGTLKINGEQEDRPVHYSNATACNVVSPSGDACIALYEIEVVQAAGSAGCSAPATQGPVGISFKCGSTADGGSEEERG